MCSRSLALYLDRHVIYASSKVLCERMVSVSSCFLFLWLCASFFQRRSASTPQTPRSVFGKSVTVCGLVASTSYALQSLGRPTFLNLDRPYPKQPYCRDLGRGPQQFFPATREGLQRQENLRERTCFSLPRRTSDRRDRPFTDYC